VSRASAVATDRVLTVPNLISFARLLGVPLFLWLLLGPHYDVAAVVVIAVGAGSDWVDGYVARRLGQVSRLGQLLDPFADRLYILATLAALTLRDVLPWEYTAALVLRELMMVVCLAVLRRHGYGPPAVHYLGKTATFIILFAFPVLLLAHATPSTAAVAGPIGWGLAWWGIVLYWLAGFLYVWQTAALIRAPKPVGTP
jgi:cardiolipin synthase (CMP-forming)